MCLLLVANLILFCDCHLGTPRNKFHFLHGTKHICFYAEGQVKAKVTDVMVKQPLDGIHRQKTTIKIFHIIMGKRSCMHVKDPVVNVRV